jgi:hypothetical protein
MMAITHRKMNERWSIELLSSRRAACQRSIGVNANTTAFIPVVITDAIAISLFQTYWGPLI